MAKIINRYLFNWQDIDNLPELKRFQLVLEYADDEEFIRMLERIRYKGRNEYPVRAIWNSLLVMYVAQHSSISSLRRELMRNPLLRQLCGFDPVKGAKAVPPAYVYSRFISKLKRYSREVKRIFEKLVNKLGEEIMDLGEGIVIDSKAIDSYSRGKRVDRRIKRDGRRDMDAEWGIKTAEGEDGEVIKKKWYGYKVHIIADSRHEIPLNYRVTKAGVNDSVMLMPMIREMRIKNRKILDRSRKIYGDMGYDSRENKSGVYDECGIIPIIPVRKLRKVKKEEGIKGLEWMYYNESGEIIYVEEERGIRCELSYSGYERKRRRQKFVCPVKAYGIGCEKKSECRYYNKSVRISINLDRRIFMPIPEHSKRFRMEIKKRTSIERINARIDSVYGFEEHTIRGLAKMEVMIGIAMIVMVTLALGHTKEKREEQMRSLVKPVCGAA